ncbi:membrane protein [Mycolicibacterium farcinogenes]|uniref:Membrane protein n=3 Tax=Mycolicibacterium TaxID=1866885 RepID=A0A378W568_9MYCO|nr:membrane protein [Mycolicibacterium farcinogenes]SUA27240.1 membrane protein [Mycolicibacterium senegalense]
MPTRTHLETCDRRGIIDGMDPDRPELDQPWDQTARHETEAERLDRNWSSLLQELRVVQTGVQLLTGLLLTLPFQERFSMLDEPMRILYLVTVACSAAATALLVAPVGMHRLLFRRHRLNLLVSASHRCAFFGLVLLGLAMTGVTELIFDTVAGREAGVIAGVVALLTFVGIWLLLPLAMRLGDPMSAGPSVELGVQRGQ